AHPDPRVVDSFFQDQLEVEAQNSITPLFKELFVYNSSGQIFASSNPADERTFVTTQPFFAPSLKDDYIQPPYYFLINRELRAVLTMRLTDEEGKTVGILAGQLNLATLGEIMTQRAGLGQTGETYLVSSENNFLLTPSRENLPLNNTYHSAGIDQVLKGEDGSGIYLNHATPPEQVIGVYHWIPELQAGLLSEIDTSEALAGTVQTFNFSIFLTVIAALIAVLVGLWRISILSLSLSDLTHTAVLIASGD